MTPELVVVLVEPSGPLNVGSVARLCANFDTTALRLVAPRCDASSAEARLMAVHGAEQLERCEHYPTLEAAVADCRRVVACSGRVEGREREHLSPPAALQWLMAPIAGPNRVALVFGREDHGLHNSELQLAGRLLRIPTGASYGSLNLSHAVAVCLAQLQLLRVGEAPTPAAPTSGSALPAAEERPAQAALEAALVDAEALLLEVGFLYPHTAAARMAKLRQLLLRSEPSSAEVALLRGMVRQLRWASRHGSSQQSQ